MAKAYRPIVIPAGTDVRVQATGVSVKGKLGAMDIPVLPGVTVSIDNGRIAVDSGSKLHRVNVGTTRAHIMNAIAGVANAYEKTLELRGMGYRVQKTKEGLQITCGYAHPVDVATPAGIAFDVSQVPNPDDTKEQMFQITVKGINRQAVGEVAAKIRAIKLPDVYRGKGVRYRGERVRKKQGKRAAGTQA